MIQIKRRHKVKSNRYTDINTEINLNNGIKGTVRRRIDYIIYGLTCQFTILDGVTNFDSRSCLFQTVVRQNAPYL